ncbi:SUMF1/EgtB/PvdO family nonheme iron enzyme [Enterobacter bugandensis]|uniref:formylglycine-generating enzyme family protein n=1 Tax=Enterobacter bugandensis TaxID=881260 RepID=UPI00266631FF|nr:SUMF1/EgtB/PvdO family nonheme iron enzyme [Enterobacter bugandensis]MDO2433346.1 SUMF1/EgtB/PvdO family nonheme iron enzyme [Enterobacter bugandensis]MDO2446389.1 SUMF1/EgtB/PvdO family nonheme iron enzyme [Enterobacter bugandensis]
MKMSYISCFIAIIIAITGCDDEKKQKEQKKLANKIVDSMVMVEGGRYQMGDFGPLVGEKLPFSPDNDNKPLHWVDLTDFKISKNRITWGEFNSWLYITNRDFNKYYKKISNREVEGKYDERMLKFIGDDYPAVANWKDAFDFCQWIGTISDKKISLPTEAQWEYAARSGGKFYQFANSNNYYNVSWPDEKQNFTFDFAPVGSFEPNPLGIFDMMGNGHDWVSDWYAEDYYQNSPEKNPQGPVSGTEKVVRGYLGSMFGLYDITRGKNKPETEAPGYGFRCVEN